jgi:hypothetical protein
MADKRYLAILAVVAIVLISVPYMIGFLTSNDQARFGGFLINPIDGHSYLSKIQQGYRGYWKFTLPYTADPGEGAYLFLFYLGLGQLNRILQLPGILLFHIVRLLSALWLILVIGKYIRSLFADRRAKKVGLLFVLFGSGLGWIAVLGGGFTSDFWVAEAYPFLSMYTNPHFSLGLGMMVYLFLPDKEESLAAHLIVGLLLGIIQPFAVVIVGLVKILVGGWKIIESKMDFSKIFNAKWFQSTVGFCLVGGIVLVYQYWAILSDPVLSQWNQQNVTVKPAPLDLLLSFSPCLILAIIGARKAWKVNQGRILLFWAGISLMLVFVPWNLQRRFLTGIFFSLAALSVFGLETLESSTSFKFRQWAVIMLFLAIPTNLIVIISGLQAISEKNPKIFLEGNFIAGLQWIDKNSSGDALVLAEQGDGLYVPSLTGRRVIYGHPFETIQAEEQQAFLAEIFFEEQSKNYYQDALTQRGVDYVLVHKGQAAPLEDWLRDNWDTVFQSNGIVVYARRVE